MDLGQFVYEIVMVAMDRAADETFTSMPCTVQSVSGNFVDVIPAIRRPIQDAEGGRAFEEYPVVPNVPIAFPQAVGFYITWDVQPGSTGILLTMKHSIAEWRRDGIVSSPGDLRPHHLGNGLFIPCVSPDDKAPAIVAGKLVIEAPEILLGKNATDLLANAVKTKGELDKIAAAFASFVPGTGGASFPTTYTTASAVACAKVKGE